MQTVPETLRRSDAGKYPNLAHSGVRDCRVPGQTHIGGCGESCDLLLNQHEAARRQARWELEAPIRAAIEAGTAVDIHDGDTYVSVIPLRVVRQYVACATAIGTDALWLDVDVVLAALNEAPAVTG